MCTQVSVNVFWIKLAKIWSVLSCIVIVAE